MPNSNLPLCVDLDGTLTYSDFSVESVLSALKRSPLLLFRMPSWAAQGKHIFKDELARWAEVDAQSTPYNEGVLSLIHEARASGRSTVLITGSNIKYAECVANHLGIFDSFYASDRTKNLTGVKKAELLDAKYGAGNYEYVSNSQVDLPIWKRAKAIVTVNARPSVVKQCAALGKPHRNIPARPAELSIWARALRVHQWAKNALVFVPLVTAHALLDASALIACILAFICFSLCASSTYIVNDLLDLDADRHHPRKRKRPFASGKLSVTSGLGLAAAALIAGLSISTLLPAGFQIATVAYIATTLAYSMRLKKVASLDVVTLASLYTLRVIAGALAAAITVSFWLLAFSMFMFLCLALVKRVAELIELQTQAGNRQSEQRIRGREYDTRDIPILQNLGSASGYMAVLVLALYINAPEVSLLYQSPLFLWLIAPLLLLWTTRLWVVTARGYMDQDPILFALKDPETWICAIITAAVLLCATHIEL